MPRKVVPSANTIVIASATKPATIKIQVIDPISVFFSLDRFELEHVDSGNNPMGGFRLDNTSPVETFRGFVGVIWGRAVSVAIINVEQYLEAETIVGVR